MKIDQSSLRNSSDITKAIFNNFYPSGQIIVKNTSYSKEGVYSKTLTSRTISDSLTGDALFRDPKFSLTFNNKMIGSSLNSLITGGADVSYSSPTTIKIFNPESTESAGASSTLVGGAAFNRIIADTIIGRQGGESVISQAARIAIADTSNARKDPAYIASLAHGNTTYTPDSGMVTSGSRTLALDASLSAEEKGWILERGKVLKEKNVVTDGEVLVSGFKFDIPNGLKGLTQTQTFFEGMQTGTSVDQSVIDAEVQTAYICPSMIELLIFLESKTSYKGNLGAERASNAASQSTNFTAATNGSSLNDHVFGRAFDITEISSRDGSVVVNFKTQGNNVATYRRGLFHLLSILDTAPKEMLPDLITVHSDLAVELGIVEGNETVQAMVKKTYANLKFVNFAADSNHKNNVHISFSAQRSGQYAGAGGALATPGSFTSPSSGGGSFVNIPPGTAPNLAGSKLSKNYQNDQSGTLTAQEVFDMLRGTVFSDEAAAIFYAVVVRESSARPAAFNPNIGTGDWSVGLFQVNLLDGAHGKKNIYLPVGGITKPGWQLSYKNWQAEGLDGKAADRKVRALWAAATGSYNQKVLSLFSKVDPLCWVPLNQAQLAYTAATGKTGSANMPASSRAGATPETGYIFFAWGDYGGGPKYGFISSVDFKDAVDVYKTCGKDPILLRDWTLAMFETSGRKSLSAPYARQWVTGTVFFKDGKVEKKWEESEIYTGGGGTYIPPPINSGPMPGDTGVGTTPGGRRNYIPGIYRPGIGAPGVTGPGATIIIPPYNPGTIPPAGNSEGPGGFNRPGLNGFYALGFARYTVGKYKYAAITPDRYGETPWPADADGSGATRIDVHGLVHKYPPGTFVFDCSGFVILVYRKAGLDFLGEFGISKSDEWKSKGGNFPDAPLSALQPLDILVYNTDSNPNGGHIVMVNQVRPDGTLETIESTPALGVGYKTVDFDRVIAAKRIFRTGYFS